VTDGVVGQVSHERVVAVPRDTPRQIEPCGAARAVGEAGAKATDKRGDLLGGELDVANVVVPGVAYEAVYLRESMYTRLSS
jgi:hypothetical protein